MVRTLTGIIAAAFAISVPVQASANVRMILTGTFAAEAPTTAYTAPGKTFKFTFGAPNFYSDLFYNNSKYTLFLGGKKIVQGEQQLEYSQYFEPSMPFYLPNTTINVGSIVSAVASYGRVRKYGDYYEGYFFNPGSYISSDSSLYLPDTASYAPFSSLNFSAIQSPRGGTGLRMQSFPSLGGVPEPAVWAMMIGGFGLVGGAMRLRATVAKATVYA